MTFFFILIILLAASVVLVSLFAPHRLPWYRPHLVLNSASGMPITIPVMERYSPEPQSQEEDPLEATFQERIQKLEAILGEKSVAIDKLQRQLAAEKAHRGEFEKVQSLLNEEIKNLRAQNRELKVRIGEANG
jgi:hypothetical protein